MRLFRFMSKKEFDKLLNGEDLINNKEHQGFTNSVGFCFMEGKEADAEYSYEFLSGIVSREICVLFETNEKLNESYGIYADPYGSFFDSITRDEYCIKKYNKETIKPIKYCDNFDSRSWENKKWKWQKIEDKFGGML